MVQILRFSREAPRWSDWSQQEIAEFYRVESALTQAGISLVTDRGLSDEGDPWFVFCRADSGEVFIHFARFDGQYVIDGAGLGHVARGRDFSALVRDLVGGEAFQLAKQRPRHGNVFLHPAALLIALVGASFFHSGDAKAAEAADGKLQEPKRTHPLSLTFESRSDAPAPLGLDTAQAATVVAGILIGLDEQRALPPAVIEASPPAEQHAAPDWLAAPAPDPLRHEPAPPPQVQTSAAAEATAPAVELNGATPVAPPETPAPVLTAADLSKLSDFGLTLSAPNIAGLDLSGAPQGALLERGAFLVTQSVILPDDGAGDVLRDISGSNQAQAAVATKLPDVMVQLIEHGSKLGGALLPASTSGGQTALISGAAGGASVPAPIAPDHPFAPAPGAELVFQPHDPIIDQAVSAFMKIVEHWSVVMTGRDLVVYDTDIFGPHASGDLDSVTFTFSDGSSISLVGTAAELSSSHLLH